MGVRICLGCLREIPDTAVRCPNCGFSLTDPVPPDALEPKTVLKKRYVIGKVLRIDGEGITYAAYDLELSAPAAIREYMPEYLAVRKGIGLEVEPGSTAKYKALLSDFVELFTQLKNLQALDNIRRVYDVFEENNTVYAACEHLNFMTLNTYLNQHAGELDWEDAAPLFKPLMESVLTINRSGFIHRGLSPENIVVLPEGRLMLIGFSICSAKVVNSEIPHSLEDGYAAPEQYMVAQHGEWTDVYGMCAVLYRVLSGTCPPSAPSREINDNLMDLHLLNEQIPPYISATVMEGLRYDYNERLQDLEILLHRLYYASDDTRMQQTVMSRSYAEDTQYFDTDSTQYLDNTASRRSTEKLQWEKGEEDKKQKKPVWLKVLLASIPVIFIACILLYQSMIGFSFFGSDKDKKTSSTDSSALSSGESSSSEASSASSAVSSEETVKKTAVNSFVGIMYDDIDFNSFSGKYGFTDPEYEYNSQFAAGTVCEQSIGDGTMVTADQKITLTISKGPQIIKLPSYDGLTPSEYADQLLNSYDITSNIEKEYSDTVAAGYVCRTAPEVGSSFDRSSGAAVIIYQSKGPEPVMNSSSPTSAESQQ